MRIAHFSDIHVTVSPIARPADLLHLKRILGAANHYLGGRARHFAGVEHRIERLLADADAQGAAHVLCTGDITAMSYDLELERAAALYGERLQHPERYTVLPGNHDRYTARALEDRTFERHFGPLFVPDGRVPAVKRIGGGVALVILDVSRPTLFASSGLCGERQRRELQAVLTDGSLKDDFVILALHYALLRENGRPDWPSHRLEDYQEVLDIIDRDDVRLDLVLHGHLHNAYSVRTRKRIAVCAGSATDLAFRCGYNIYELDLEHRTFGIERRTWRAGADGYRASNERMPR